MNKTIISKDRKEYLRKIKKRKYLILLTQILILVSFLGIWEILADNGIIDSFITSQPSKIFATFMDLTSNDLLKHIGVTVYETVVGFLVGTTLGIAIAIVLNSLPKVALRTNNYYLGWSRNASNYCYGSSNFFDCNNIRKPKWLFKN